MLNGCTLSPAWRQGAPNSSHHLQKWLHAAGSLGLLAVIAA
jgi:hypothetical protein